MPTDGREHARHVVGFTRLWLNDRCLWVINQVKSYGINELEENSVVRNFQITAADSNKRTGSFLFLWYLRINQKFLAKPVEALINDNTLVALALLVAESRPEQKELIIRLVQQFILLKD